MSFAIFLKNYLKEITCTQLQAREIFDLIFKLHPLIDPWNVCGKIFGIARKKKEDNEKIQRFLFMDS